MHMTALNRTDVVLMLTPEEALSYVWRELLADFRGYRAPSELHQPKLRRFSFWCVEHRAWRVSAHRVRARGALQHLHHHGHHSKSATQNRAQYSARASRQRGIMHVPRHFTVRGYRGVSQTVDWRIYSLQRVRVSQLRLHVRVRVDHLRAELGQIPDDIVSAPPLPLGHGPADDVLLPVFLDTRFNPFSAAITWRQRVRVCPRHGVLFAESVTQDRCVVFCSVRELCLLHPILYSGVLLRAYLQNRAKSEWPNCRYHAEDGECYTGPHRSHQRIHPILKRD